jgi:hypothetical protein
MGQALKYRHEKHAAEPTSMMAALGALLGPGSLVQTFVPGLLAAGTGSLAARQLRPWLRSRSLSQFKPQELLTEGLAGMINASKGTSEETAKVLREALQSSGPGAELLQQVGREGTTKAIQPWQLGLTGLGGLALGQFMADEQKSPMIFK